MFRTESEPTHFVKHESDSRVEDEYSDRDILCLSCKAPITKESEAVRINDSHRHVFVNPHGLVFEVGCYGNAGNVLCVGQITSEFTWFPGYSWQAVSCALCLTHLGWVYYLDGNEAFFGFILDRLARQ
ncbi:cereblon family protein [Desulfonatronovibrio magnus]|uniref:cereblon family protein n=1 Tax=Desulfonatronovibrio magnus TaxID=698827 RepID=UPI0005EB6E61|nr:cereblon family protein [Desulfonatronovibrio magnus]